jgi:H+/gluconate symporter-like permease
VFVVPGLGTLAIAGLLDVPLGTMLIYGTLIGPPTAVLTTYSYGRLLRYGLWNEAKDETHFEELHEQSPSAAEDAGKETPRRRNTEARRTVPPLCTSRCCPSWSRCS